MDTEGPSDRVKNQKDIMSVCLAVVRGVLTPDQARSAILGRTASGPVSESLRLSADILREAEALGRLPAQEKEECLAIFKELYDQPPPEEILRSDEALARALIDQRLVSPGQAQECLSIQARLAGSGTHPLPRLGELLLRKGYLVPGPSAGGAAGGAPEPPGSDARSDRILMDLHRELPSVVRALLPDPSARFGRYLRTQLLGKGGVGEVWKAWDLELGRWVALKFLKFEDAEELARLKREAQTAAKLAHPNIATVYEIAEARDRTFLVMEYVEGQTLETFPRDNREKLVAIVRDVTLALHDAHTRGVIHRDIKPGNIMVDSSGRPLVMDFGLARQVETNRSIPGMILGTPAYMPPEQAIGERADLRSDVYSIGATLYELLSDKPPFRGEGILEVLRKVTSEEPEPMGPVPEELRTIVLKCLMKEPSRRYRSALELAEDLRRWEEGEPIQAHPPSLAYRLRKKILKRRAVFAVALGGILLATGVAVFVVPRWLEKDRELRIERENQARKERALDQARPFLDEGRRILERLDRVLATEDFTPESVKTLAREAHRQLDRALEISPGFPDALLQKARACQADGDPSLALDYCRRAIEASEQFGTAYLQRARILLDRFEALRHSSRLRLSPETREEKELAAKLRDDLKEVDAWSKDQQEILFARGALAFVNGDYAEAGRSLQAYSQLVFSDYRGWAWAGHSWLHVPGKEEAAVQALSQAMKFRPRLAPLFVYRGFAYLQKSATLRRAGEIDASSRARDDAGRDFKRASEIDPGSPEASLGAGDVLRARWELSAAVEKYTLAIQNNPRNAVAYLRRAATRLEQGDPDGGFADANEAIRMNPIDPRALLERAALEEAREGFKAARSDIDEALKVSPDDVEALIGRGKLKAHQADFAGAEKDFSRALELKPDLAEAYRERGISRRSQGDFKRAVEDLSRAIELDRGDPWTYYHRGVTDELAGNLEGAVQDLEKGLQLGSSHRAKFYLRLWLARARQGDRAGASRALAPLLEPSLHLASTLIASLARALSADSSDENFEVAREHETPSNEDLCIGWYYSGEKAILEKRDGRAKELLEKCLATGRCFQDEYETAQQALRSLGRKK